MYRSTYTPRPYDESKLLRQIFWYRVRRRIRRLIRLGILAMLISSALVGGWWIGTTLAWWQWGG